MINLFKRALNLNQSPSEEYGSEFHQPVSLEAYFTHNNKQLQVYYQGILKHSGAQDIYLHYGLENWNHPSTVKMERTSDGGFIAKIQPESSEVNFCFRDNADNWDNNNGSNWKAQISLH